MCLEWHLEPRLRSIQAWERSRKSLRELGTNLLPSFGEMLANVAMCDVLRELGTEVTTAANAVKEEVPPEGDKGPAPMEVETPGERAVASHVVDMDEDEEPPGLSNRPKSESEEMD